MDDATAPESPQDRIDALLAEQQRIEAQMQQVQEHLTQSHRLETLGTLASVVAHEYNNLLTPVVNYCQMALKREDDPALMRKALQKSLEGARRATRISNSILGLARQGADDGLASLPAVVEEARACLVRAPEKDGIRVEADVPEVQVAMSPLNLQQVLVNLLLNARKALRQTGGRVSIHGVAEASQAVRLTVADNGPGVPDEIQDRLFEPFVTQPHVQTVEADTGTGLGLCICRDLVTQAGGEIAFTSQPGEGTTFTLHLPQPTSNPDESAQPTDAISKSHR
jgi:signal transduction histidine kinase